MVGAGPGVPKYTVDLDVAEDHRWDHIVPLYAEQLREATRWIETALLPEAWWIRLVYTVIVHTCTLLVHPLPVVVLLVGLLLARFTWGVLPLVLFVGVSLTIPYRREVSGIARCAGLAPGKLLLVQYIYEFVSACTSVIVRDAETGCPVRIALLDLDVCYSGPLPSRNR